MAESPQHNTRELTREMLIAVLDHFSTLLPNKFNNMPVRLVVHGGACMLLHPDLDRLASQTPPFLLSPRWSPGAPLQPDAPDVKRTQTRDVDIIARSLDLEWHHLGISDPFDRLKDCIASTARRFGLGLDWMNADADVALPMAVDPVTGMTYDPIHADTLKPNNVHRHTIYRSTNGMLQLISVTPFWAVALKLVRYTRNDPGDICLILRNGTNISGTRWTRELVEKWLVDNCWPMGYASYDHRRWAQLETRIDHVVAMVNAYDDDQELQEEENRKKRSKKKKVPVMSSPGSEASFVPPTPETALKSPPPEAHAPSSPWQQPQPQPLPHSQYPYPAQYAPQHPYPPPYMYFTQPYPLAPPLPSEAAPEPSTSYVSRSLADWTASRLHPTTRRNTDDGIDQHRVALLVDEHQHARDRAQTWPSPARGAGMNISDMGVQPNIVIVPVVDEKEEKRKRRVTEWLDANAYQTHGGPPHIVTSMAPPSVLSPTPMISVRSPTPESQVVSPRISYQQQPPLSPHLAPPPSFQPQVQSRQQSPLQQSSVVPHPQQQQHSPQLQPQLQPPPSPQSDTTPAVIPPSTGFVPPRFSADQRARYGPYGREGPLGVHRRQSYYESDEDRDDDEDGLTTPSPSTGDRDDRESIGSSGFGSPRGVGVGAGASAGTGTGGVETESDEDWEEARVRVVGPAGGEEQGVFIPPLPSPAPAPSQSQWITTVPLLGAWVGVATNPNNRTAGNGNTQEKSRRGGMRELAEMVSGIRIRGDGPSSPPSSSSSHLPPSMMGVVLPPYGPSHVPQQPQQQQQRHQPYLNSWISSSTATLRGPTRATRPITPQEVFIPPAYTPSPRPFHNANVNRDDEEDEDEEEETDSYSDGSIDQNTLLSFPQHEGAQAGPAHHPYAHPQLPYPYAYPPHPSSYSYPWPVPARTN